VNSNSGASFYIERMLYNRHKTAEAETMDHSALAPISFAGSPVGAITGVELVRRAEALTPLLWERAAETEEQRRPPEATRQDLKRTGIHRVLQPARFGGAGGGFREAVDILRAVGRGCGSTAWILAQNIAHNMMVSQWPEAAQQTVWGGMPDALISGILIPGIGKARAVDGGYILSGRWPFLTGVDLCDWAMFTAFVPNTAGEMEDLHFLVPRAQFEIHDTWKAMGLRGSCSNDVTVAEVFVPKEMTAAGTCFRGGDTLGSRLNAGLLYRAPCYAMFGVVIGSAALGVAEAMVETYLTQSRGRVAAMSGGAVTSYTTQHVKVAQAITAIGTARILMHETCDLVMAILAEGREPTDQERTQFRCNATFAGQMANQAVNAIWDAGGGASIYDRNPLSRLFRDSSAASRHITMNWDVNAAAFGRVALGLPIDNPAL
jgi:3-hydroxy-9,10-secoandrosta-1,3,5(10)-triene-9,17-dione monooxygenase